MPAAAVRSSRRNILAHMKYPLSIPSTPVKRKNVAKCEVSLAAGLISKKIDEFSFYNIYLTKDQTVLRIAKRRESGELEASILEMVHNDHVNSRG